MLAPRPELPRKHKGQNAQRRVAPNDPDPVLISLTIKSASLLFVRHVVIPSREGQSGDNFKENRRFIPPALWKTENWKQSSPKQQADVSEENILTKLPAGDSLFPFLLMFIKTKRIAAKISDIGLFICERQTCYLAARGKKKKKRFHWRKQSRKLTELVNNNILNGRIILIKNSSTVIWSPINREFILLKISVKYHSHQSYWTLMFSMCLKKRLFSGFLASSQEGFKVISKVDFASFDVFREQHKKLHLRLMCNSRLTLKDLWWVQDESSLHPVSWDRLQHTHNLKLDRRMLPFMSIKTFINDCDRIINWDTCGFDSQIATHSPLGSYGSFSELHPKQHH